MSDQDPTRRMEPVDATRAMPASRITDEPTQAIGPVGDPAGPGGPFGPGGPDDPNRSLKIGLGAVAVLVVLALIGLLLANAGDDDGQDLATEASTTTVAPSTSAEETTTTAESTTTIEESSTTEAPTTAAPTTARPTTTRPATTGTTIPPGTARVSLVNSHPSTVNVNLNGRSFTLRSGQRTTQQAIPPASAPGTDGDAVTITLQDDPSCGLGDHDSLFEPDKAYVFSVMSQDGACGTSGAQNVGYKVMPA